MEMVYKEQNKENRYGKEKQERERKEGEDMRHRKFGLIAVVSGAKDLKPVNLSFQYPKEIF